VGRNVRNGAEHSLDYAAEAKCWAEYGVPGSPLCPGVHALAILLVSPSDCNEFDALQEVRVIVWDDPSSTVTEYDVAKFQRLGLSWVLGANDLARTSCKEEAGDEEIDRVIDRASCGLSL
jgi:hypothetical protein